MYGRMYIYNVVVPLYHRYPQKRPNIRINIQKASFDNCPKTAKQKKRSQTLTGHERGFPKSYGHDIKSV